MSVAARYLRQVLLPEIGAEGQRRIAASAARVAGDPAARIAGDPASLAHEVASLYARGAGFGALEAGPIDVAALAPEAIVSTPAAREVLAGARAALGEMRRAIKEIREEPRG